MAEIFNFLTSILRIFCGGNQQQQQQQQHPQQQYPPQQQEQQYPQQQQQQQQQYPPPQQNYQQQQQAYPPQSQPSWANVAGGQQHQQHQQNQQHHQQHQQHQQHQNGQQQQHQQQQQYQQQNGHGPSRPYNLPSGGVVGPHHPGYQNQDQVNATNSRYTDLRNRARSEGDEAHRSGDGARAHELSVEGKEHQRKQDQLDDEAGGWIFSQNNASSPQGTIDLHGLYVKEAIEKTELAITQSQSQGLETLRIIVGKGIHSQGHVAKIKPAVEDLMAKYNLTAHIDPENTGVLIVDLAGRQGGGRSRDAGGIVDQLGGQNEGCTIM